MRAMFYTVANSGVFDRVHNGDTANPTQSFTKKDNVDDDEFYGGQIALAWHATDSLTIKPRFMYQKTKSDNLPLADIDPDNFTVSRLYDIEESGEEEWWLASVTLNLDTGLGSVFSNMK